MCLTLDLGSAREVTLDDTNPSGPQTCWTERRSRLWKEMVPTGGLDLQGVEKASFLIVHLFTDGSSKQVWWWPQSTSADRSIAKLERNNVPDGIARHAVRSNSKHASERSVDRFARHCR